MKIDKIIFACSSNFHENEKNTEYSSFWNIQSKLWKTAFNIEPVCLLYGKKKYSDMSEEYGKIIEMQVIPNVPLIIQLIWSKFYYPTYEPDTTWLMGDIDLLPLQKNHFVDNIKDIDDDYFIHLNAGGNCNNKNTFLEEGSQVDCQFGRTGRFGADLPGHYWAGKGEKFEIFTKKDSFLNQITYIQNSYRYGVGVKMGYPKPNETNINTANSNSFYWCSEEMRSSELMWEAIKNKKVKFKPFFYGADQRIDRSGWNESLKNYSYSQTDLMDNKIVDIHCLRPYDRQKEACEKIINISKILNK